MTQKSSFVDISAPFCRGIEPQSKIGAIESERGILIMLFCHHMWTLLWLSSDLSITNTHTFIQIPYWRNISNMQLIAKMLSKSVYISYWFEQHKYFCQHYVSTVKSLNIACTLKGVNSELITRAPHTWMWILGEFYVAYATPQ